MGERRQADGGDRQSPADCFRRITAAACDRLEAAANCPSAESSSAAMLTASRAVGFLEALMLVAPDVARSLTPEASRLEAALDRASIGGRMRSGW